MLLLWYPGILFRGEREVRENADETWLSGLGEARQLSKCVSVLTVGYVSFDPVEKPL